MLRQTIDQGGFYDLKSNEFIKIIDMIFVAAMGIPGGGRSLPTKRLTRHFNFIHIPPFSNDNLFRIFSSILDWGYSSYPDVW
jgi:dynein heavy chain